MMKTTGPLFHIDIRHKIHAVIENDVLSYVVDLMMITRGRVVMGFQTQTELTKHF